MLTTLFYPYATEENLDKIKALLLYFDKTYIISPVKLSTSTPIVREIFDKSRSIIKETKAYKFYNVKYLDKKLNYWKDDLLEKIIRFDQHTAELQESGLIEILHPVEDLEFMELNKNLLSVTENYFNKIFDQDFAKRISDNKGRGVPLSIIDRARTIDRDPNIDYEFFGFEAAKNSIAKILMDFSLYVAAKKQLIPMTDNSPILNLFFHNLKELTGKTPSSKKSSSNNLLSTPMGHAGSPSYDIEKVVEIYDNVVPHRTIDLYLPNVKHLSFEDIVYLREKLSPELQNFRNEIEKITFDIRNREFEKDFLREIDYVVSTKVGQSIRELKRGLSLLREKHIYKTIKKVLSIGSVISVAGFAFPNIPLPLALILNWSITGVTGWLDYKIDRKELMEKNGFSFLLTTGIDIEEPKEGISKR
jgi:hypothetical protein